MANDFMNWRMSTSVKLLGIPHKRNKNVTSTNGSKCPEGKSGAVVAVSSVAAGAELETCKLRSPLSEPLFNPDRTYITRLVLNEMRPVREHPPASRIPRSLSATWPRQHSLQDARSKMFLGSAASLWISAAARQGRSGWEWHDEPVRLHSELHRRFCPPRAGTKE